MKTGYFYDTHVHESYSSLCGHSTGQEYADGLYGYKMSEELREQRIKEGYKVLENYDEIIYAGFFLTNHFFRGNTAIDRSLPWRQFVDEYYHGYELTHEACKKNGIDVFYGWEENFEGDEFLIYGLPKDFQYAHPDMITWNQVKNLEECNKAGGFVVQAHPFRDRNYLSFVAAHPYQSEAFEVHNDSNSDGMNLRAYIYASEHDKPMTSGSDSHDVAYARKMGAGFIVPERIKSSEDYINLIKNRKTECFMIPDKTKGIGGRYEILNKPAYLYDENNVRQVYEDELVKRGYINI
ncbi:MAG: hypothetical protein MJ113_05755 [Lachnospiraceae bacterium]|nr:hypothetical protein [Lachnospiraceae bacterium]